MKKWTIGTPDAAVVDALHKNSDLSVLSCHVLASQGCINIRQAAELIGCDTLSSPFQICDMKPAAEAINAAVDEGKRICIYGDYDCDGIMATVILFSFLNDIGADVTWRIPERKEGYGLNETAVREMHEDGVELVVTVDNGISAIREAALMKELGMGLVITDHHQPGETLPEALAVVDAHRKENTSPFRMYCGAGIALMLVAALNDFDDGDDEDDTNNNGNIEMAMTQFGDLAAIATIADVVPLTGENRYLVQEGLDLLENTERPGLRALREISGLGQKPLSSTNVAYSLSPRINAAGRLASPKLAAELLLEENPSRARELAERLDAINADRKQCEAEILHAIRMQLAEDAMLLHERILIFSGEGWHAGVIGIVAARLQERYGKPCFIISVENGVGHGSARSFGDVSVFGCLTACGDLLEKYGGHPAAGGFTIREEHIPAFRKRVAEYAAAHHPDMPFPELQAACVLRPEFLTPAEAKSLSQLEPFGAGNPEPVFMVENAVIKEIRPLSSGIHTKLMIETCGVQCEALIFRMAPENTGLRIGTVCHMMVHLNVNCYMGQEKVSLVVQDFRVSGLKQGKILSAMQAYDKYRRNETLSPAYYKAICPTRAECAVVYKAIPEKGISVERLSLLMYAESINYCKMRICLDIFTELGLAAIEEGEASVRRIPGVKRVELQSSHILSDIEKRAKEESI